MKKNVLVSICCITYNHVNYIRQCLDGFMMQKTDFDFEVLIHDDASNDGTDKIIKEYEAKYPEIVIPIYENENQWSKGLCGSAIFNYPRARGKYVAICEGDDYWIDSYKLQKQVDFLENHNDYSLCCHNAFNLRLGLKNEAILFNSFSKDIDTSLEQLINGWIVPTASIMVRTEVARYNPNWCESIYSSDYRLLLLSYDKGKIRLISEIMSVYRSLETGRTVSNITKYQPIFVWSQHIKLLESFNKGTNFKYSEVINHRIFFLKNEIKFHKVKDFSVLLAFILMPKTFIIKIKGLLLKKLNIKND